LKKNQQQNSRAHTHTNTCFLPPLAHVRLLQREEETRLLEKWLVEDLTPEERSSLAPGLLDRACETIRAKVREGLEQADRGEFIDGEEFFARWKSWLESADPSNSSRSTVK